VVVLSGKVYSHHDLMVRHMNVKKSPSVDFAIRTLHPAERKKVFAWLDHLANWENDQHTREESKPSIYKDVFVLTTSDDFRISFSLDIEKKEITVLDITRPSRFATANHASE
jgi:hypothetical protein